MGLLSSQWDRYLIQNWKGDSEYIRSLKRGDALEEAALHNIKSKKEPRASINQRNSIINETDQFFSFKEYKSKAKFSKNKRVSIMKQRLMTKDIQNKKFDNIIPSIMPHTLEISPNVKLKNEL